MKRIFLVLTLIAMCVATTMAQQQGDQRRQPITQEQIEQMNARRSQMIKKQLDLTAEQEAVFDKEYANYNNIVLATRTQQFKNRIEKDSSTEQAVAAINDIIDGQLAELVAKKQMINHLKDVLSAEQLAKLHMFTSNMGMGMRGRQGNAQQQRSNNAQRRARQNSDWGSGFGNIDSDSDDNQ